ncbi:hypothetical protein A0257_11115 [Hymenobacter psoromatis]|nr:hypothetical protein A0257_11115 [Hymenobacter psoromatis]
MHFRAASRQPLRWLGWRVSWLRAALVTALTVRLSGLGRLLALAVLLGPLSLYCYVAGTRAAHQPTEWMRTGGNALHLGQELRLSAIDPANARAGGQPGARAAGSYPIAALSLEPSTSCPTLPRLVTALAEQQRLPLLSWTVAVGSGRRRAYWHSLAVQLKRVPGPVLLRPLLDAPTAAAYRRDWRYMVDELTQAGVENAIWVWTPTAADSTFQRFPGPAYASWLANPLVSRDNALSYPALRARAARALPLPQLPVLLLAPCPSGSPLRAAQRLAQAYPRVKAIVFDATARQSLLTASLTPPQNQL